MQRRWPVVLLMAAILGLIPASGWVAARTPDHVQLFIEGTPLMTAVPAKAVGTRVMVPLRDVFAALGAAVEWQAPTQTVTVKKDASVLVDLPVVGSHEKLMSLLEQAQQWIAAGAGLKTGGATPTLRASQAVAEASSAAAPDYSATNVQVPGVDEADIVKTDGEYIYQVNNRRVVVVKAYPPEKMQVSSVLEFANEFVPQELYVDDQYLVVLGTTPSDGPIIMPQEPQKVRPEIWPPPICRRNYVKAVIYDIRDKGAIKKLREVELEGEYVSSRKVGAALYLVAIKGLDCYHIMRGQGKEGILPSYYDSAGKAEYVQIGYHAIRYIPGAVEPAYLLVAGLRLDRPEEKMEVSAYLGAGQNVYASPHSLYVAATRYETVPWTPDTRLRPMPPPKAQTAIYKFALQDGRVLYRGKGVVPGTVLNQFSMDEHRGYFRLATTVGEVWRTDEHTAKNNIYVLDDSLEIVGKLENLAPTERIYAVRFLGDRAYMVTFRTVDPLFVIDLHDPHAPKVLGALKIPGYSDYLHPYDENHLIGFGKDTVEITQDNRQDPKTGTMAFYQGMKLALFDVSDVAHPVEKFKEIIGDRGTDSPLLQNHKALLFSKEKDLLAFPVTVLEIKHKGESLPRGMPPYGEFTFQGAYVYGLDLVKGFTLKARITHLEARDYLEAGDRWYASDKNVERILYLGNTLYTVSRRMIKAHDLASFGEKGSLTLP